MGHIYYVKDRTTSLTMPTCAPYKVNCCVRSAKLRLTSHFLTGLQMMQNVSLCME